LRKYYDIFVVASTKIGLLVHTFLYFASECNKIEIHTTILRERNTTLITNVLNFRPFLPLSDTNMTMVITCTKSYSKRNLSIKAIISVFVGFGICCAIVAIRSCRWFVFLQKETNENRLVEEWEFFPEIMNSTTSIGLFRYETNNTIIPYEVVYADTTTPDNLNSNNNLRCEPYPEFWVSAPDYRWKFTAQLFVMLGPIIAFQSVCLAIIGAKRFWICTFLLLAMGLQTATVITAVSWCDRYWDCPWLMGAKVNLTAACSFLVGWLFAMLGLVDRNDNNDNYNEQQNSRRAKRKNGDERAAYDSDDSDSISVNITNVHDEEEEFSSTSGEMTQVDIEDGSNDGTIYNPWMQDDDGDDSINDDHKKNNDDDDDDDDANDDDDEEEKNAEKKYMKKRVSQSNQIFLDLAPKLEQRRHEMLMEVE
jgi:hypothetical protein